MGGLAVHGDEDPRRQMLLELLQIALAAVDGRRRTREALSEIVKRSPAPAAERFAAAAVGKAAASMALGAADALCGALERVLIITKDGHVDAEARGLRGVEIIESGHPVPDQRSLEAGARLCAFLEDLDRGVRPLFLVSGGASSLAEALVPGASLEDLRRLNSDAHASALPIAALNARRRALSRLKGGQLAARLAGRHPLALLISDVPGDDPAVIGSGLAGPAPQGTDDTERHVVARLTDALEAVADRAAGLAPVAHSERFSGTAERLAVRFAHELALGSPGLRIWGGESLMELPERPGRGGRNQHLALAAARLIAGHDDLFLLAAGTDGTDGPTGDAGALVDGDTCARIACAGLDVDECLRRANSGAALAAAGDLVSTGPTGTNVGDLVLGLKLPRSETHALPSRVAGAGGA